MPKTFAFGGKRRYKKLRGRHAKKVDQIRDEMIDSLQASDEDENRSFTQTDDADGMTACASMDDEITDQRADQTDGEVNADKTRSEMKFESLTHEDDYTSICDLERYFIIHSTFFAALMDILTCHCQGSDVHMETSKNMGLACKFTLFCNICQDTVWSSYTSPKPAKRYDINVRAVLASKESGVNLNSMTNMFTIMNIPQPMHHKTYADIAGEVRDAAVAAVEDNMRQAAAVVKERHAAGIYTSAQTSPSGRQVVGVSFDGTWHKRGHSSHYGVGVAIDIDSGLVLDTYSVSNFCKGCFAAPQEDPEQHRTWLLQHKPICAKNFDGSSNAMEMEAAEKIFSRSIERRNLIYGTMLCDGDSKSLKRVNDVKPYDIEVIKEDCINHIAKRMFNQLETLKQSNKAALNRKLTKPIIEKITNTYAANLKRNAPDPVKMKEGVLAGFFHMSSSDKEPNHRLCPDGTDSWCRFKRAIAKGEDPPPHHQTFSKEVSHYVYPVVKRLTDLDLLQRCAKMTTQNPNESFNAQIWRRCPKTEFVHLPAIETAVALAVLSFNIGPVGVKMVMERLGLGWHQINSSHALKKAKTRIRHASRKEKGISKWKRKNNKRRRIVEEHNRETQEGETYAAGAFNC